jgi:hypothetical protein
LDDGATWSDFLPDNAALLTSGEESAEAYESLLTEQDWRELQKHLSEGYEPKLAAELVAKTHQLIEQQQLRGAVLQTSLALEVALNEFMQRKMRMNKVLAENLHPWSGLTLPVRLAAVATSPVWFSPAGRISAEAHGDEPKVIRDGWLPPATAKEELRHALQTIAGLLSGPSSSSQLLYSLLRLPLPSRSQRCRGGTSVEPIPQAIASHRRKTTWLRAFETLTG